MNVPSRDDLTALISAPEGPCISMFMPMKRGGAETLENPTRFKNLLREAEKRLLDDGLREIEVKALLKPAAGLLEDRAFWQHQADGLAAFLGPEGFRHYGVPLALPQLVVLARRYHVTPLLPLLGDGRFYLLALSQKQVRLLQCTRYDCSEVQSSKLPKSVADALQYDTPERQIHLHTAQPGRSTRGSAIFHGRGGGADELKENVLQCFQQIDRGLREVLREKRAPLLLAGVQYLLPLYRAANTYPLLVEGEIDGNPEGQSAEALHARAAEVMQPHFEKARTEAAAQYRELAGTERASHRVRKIVPAADQGRVGLLFVALGVQQWGTFDPQTNDLHLHEAPRQGNEDLLNLAAVRALATGGKAYAVAQEEMPADGPLAAVFRY